MLNSHTSLTFALLFVLCARVLAADVPAHPRLYFTREDLPRIRESGFTAEQYLNETEFTVRYFGGKMVTYPLPPQQPGKMEEPPGFEKSFGHYPYWTMMSRGFQSRMYNLSLAYAAAADEEYARRAIDYTLALSKWSVWTDLDYGTHTCLDTCHTTLGVAVVYDMCYDAMTDSERAALREAIVKLGLEPLMADIGARAEHNLHMLRASALGMGGLALLGESPRAEEYVAAARDYYKWFLDSRFTSPNTEGMGYTSYGMENCMAFADVLRRARGDDSLLKHPAADMIVRWAIYFQCPRATGLVNFSDSGIANYFATTMKVLNNSLGNGYAGWYLEKSKLSDGKGWAGVIYGNPERAKTPPTDWPTSAVFQNIGWVALRSDWTEDGALLAFQSGDSRMGHNHRDQNNFVLNYAGEWLITDLGYKRFAGGAKTFFDINTVGHNSLLVDGEGQDKLGGGKITSFFTSGAFDYTAGDASGSYDPSKLSRFVRRITQVKPGYFVMLDAVESEGTPRTFEWLLHTDTNGKYLFDGQPAEAGDCGQIRRVTIAKENASVVAELLLPETGQVRLVEYEGAEEFGPYVTVSPLAKTRKTLFLTTLTPSKTGDTNGALFSPIEGKGTVGVQTTGPAGGDVVLFRTGSGVSRAPEVSFIGESCFVRTDDSREATCFALCDGRKLQLRGTPLILTSRKASVAVSTGPEISADISASAETEVRFRIPREPVAALLDGRPTEFRYDAPSQMVVLNVPAGEHAVRLTIGDHNS